MSAQPLRVTVLNWRDTTHPEGGGSERFIENIAADLVSDGCDVDILCASHERAHGEVNRRGIAFHHSGGRFGVYPAALTRLLGARFGRRRPDVVIDVHNGVPFFARLLSPSPVVVLVHHVHREQWGVVFGPWLARFGWWLESKLSPWLHRGCQYIAVSEITRNELIELGVRPSDIAVVHNGSDPVLNELQQPTLEPQLVVLGRLVPHKRVEHAIDAVAELRQEFPGLTLRVVGDGWWREELKQHALNQGVADAVIFDGFVSEEAKGEILSSSWLMLAPSVKEGWGLMVMEAAVHGVPSVAYDNAGGLSESIIDGRTGRTVPDHAEFLAVTRQLLSDHALRREYGEQARANAQNYSWRTASTSALFLLQRAAAGQAPTDVTDPTRVVEVELPAASSKG